MPGYEPPSQIHGVRDGWRFTLVLRLAAGLWDWADDGRVKWFAKYTTSSRAWSVVRNCHWFAVVFSYMKLN